MTGVAAAPAAPLLPTALDSSVKMFNVDEKKLQKIDCNYKNYLMSYKCHKQKMPESTSAGLSTIKLKFAIRC